MLRLETVFYTDKNDVNIQREFLPDITVAQKEAPAVGTFGAVQELRYFYFIIRG